MGATSGDAKRSLRVPLNHLQSGKPPRGLRATSLLLSDMSFQGETCLFDYKNLTHKTCFSYFLVSRGESGLIRGNAARAF